MRKLNRSLLAGLALTPLLCAASGALANDEGRNQFKARLSGYNEPSAVSTTGSGEFKAKVDRHGVSFEYELSFQNLEGDVRQAHIHFGQVATNGGISIWLCGTTPSNPGPAGTPDCGGARSGRATRTVTAADVIGPAGQGISPMEFEEVLAAMRAGVTYANVHSTLYPGGEIRGQIRGKRGDD